MRTLGPGRFSVDADLPAHGWLQTFGVAVAPDAPAQASTVGGLVMARLGRVAAAGDKLDLGAVRLTVEDVDGHRVQTVRVELSGRKAATTRPEGGTA